MKKLVIASGNPGKLREIGGMLAPLAIEVVPQADFGVPEADEPHCTFIENALAKARHASRHTGLPALADDSGICVAALGGDPGVRSARYADEFPGSPQEREHQDRRNNEKLIAALGSHADRRAHYYCVIVLVRRAEDPEPLIAEGRWHGEVIAAPRGTNGFGYDPMFVPDGYDITYGEMAPAQKYPMTHRARAFAQLKAAIMQDDGNSGAS